MALWNKNMFLEKKKVWAPFLELAFSSYGTGKVPSPLCRSGNNKPTCPAHLPRRAVYRLIGQDIYLVQGERQQCGYREHSPDLPGEDSTTPLTSDSVTTLCPVTASIKWE